MTPSSTTSGTSPGPASHDGYAERPSLQKDDPERLGAGRVEHDGRGGKQRRLFVLGDVGQPPQVIALRDLERGSSERVGVVGRLAGYHDLDRRMTRPDGGERVNDSVEPFPDTQVPEVEDAWAAAVCGL